MAPSLVSPISGAVECAPAGGRKRKVARVLLADADLATRLTLKLLLSAAGYAVDCAASVEQAIVSLDAHEYQLVLADLGPDLRDEALRLLAYARAKEFQPATALISSKMTSVAHESGVESPAGVVGVSDDTVSFLLGRVAELISRRARRRIRARMSRPVPVPARPAVIDLSTCATPEPLLSF